MSADETRVTVEGDTVRIENLRLPRNIGEWVLAQPDQAEALRLLLNEGASQLMGVYGQGKPVSR